MRSTRRVWPVRSVVPIEDGFETVGAGDRGLIERAAVDAAALFLQLDRGDVRGHDLRLSERAADGRGELCGRTASACRRRASWSYRSICPRTSRREGSCRCWRAGRCTRTRIEPAGRPVSGLPSQSTTARTVIVSPVAGAAGRRRELIVEMRSRTSRSACTAPRRQSLLMPRLTRTVHVPTSDGLMSNIWIDDCGVFSDESGIAAVPFGTEDFEVERLARRRRPLHGEDDALRASGRRSPAAARSDLCPSSCRSWLSAIDAVLPLSSATSVMPRYVEHRRGVDADVRDAGRLERNVAQQILVDLRRRSEADGLDGDEALAQFLRQAG